MKKLSEFKGREATNLLGKLLLSVSDMLDNAENKAAYQSKGAIGLIGMALIQTPDAVVGLLAALNEVPVEKYEYNVISLANDSFEIFKDPELVQLFGSQN